MHLQNIFLAYYMLPQPQWSFHIWKSSPLSNHLWFTFSSFFQICLLEIPEVTFALIQGLWSWLIWTWSRGICFYQKQILKLEKLKLMKSFSICPKYFINIDYLGPTFWLIMVTPIMATRSGQKTKSFEKGSNMRLSGFACQFWFGELNFFHRWNIQDRKPDH